MLSTPSAKLFATADERSVANDSHLGGGAMVARWWRVGGALVAVAAAASLPFCYQFGIEYIACRCAGDALPLRWRCECE